MIAILAAVVIVSYSGITRRAQEVAVQSDLRNAATQISILQVENGTYPSPALPSDVQASGGRTFQYTSDGASFCLTVISENNSAPSYYVQNDSSITQGACPGHTGGPVIEGNTMQAVTSLTCPTTRTRVVDARDNHTYWIQKLADGKCWMLTNLAYAGGGTNTYNDVKTLTNGTGGSATYAVPSYYIVPSTTSYTTEPTAPSVATDGTGQYGYLYNWCGAMGGQSTAACANASTPAPNVSVSVCPAGWRLPTNTGAEFSALNTAVNGGSTSTDSGLRINWLAQRAGFWSAGFSFQGSEGYYWSSTQSSASYARGLYHDGSSVAVSNSTNKNFGFAVRCVAS